MSRRRGSAALEYALVLPVLLALAFALIDWSWYFFEWMTVTRAAGQGVRVATGLPMSQDPLGVAEAEARRWMATGLASGGGAPSVTARLVPDGESSALEVEVTAPFGAPIDLFWTPPVLRASAQGTWYGDQMGE